METKENCKCLRENITNVLVRKYPGTEFEILVYCYRSKRTCDVSYEGFLLAEEVRDSIVDTSGIDHRSIHITRRLSDMHLGRLLRTPAYRHILHSPMMRELFDDFKYNRLILS